MTLAQAILVAIIAGVTTAFLSGQLTPGAMTMAFFSLLAPTPILIAGFGWHPLVAALAGLVAALVVDVAVGTRAALLIAALTVLPAYAISAYADRLFGDFSGRPEKDGIDLGRIATAAILYIAMLAVTVGLLVESDLTAMMTRIRATVEVLWNLVREANPGFPQANTRDAARMLDFITAMIPPVSAAMSLLTLVLSAALAMQITDRFGRLVFPKPDFRRFRLPGGALIMLGMALLASTRAGYLGLFGELVAVMLFVVYALQGLAVTHVWTINLAGRVVVLGVIWVALIVLGLPAIVFIGVGMADHLLNFRRGKL